MLVFFLPILGLKYLGIQYFIISIYLFLEQDLITKIKTKIMGLKIINSHFLSTSLLLHINNLYLYSNSDIYFIKHHGFECCSFFTNIQAQILKFLGKISKGTFCIFGPI